MAEDFMAMYKQALERLSTGGMSLEASLQEIEEGKKQAIAGGQQALVSGGLAGTTIMGGVPIQAEKVAARQRLGARGRAEEKYLSTLASFAAFAQRGEEAQKQRDWETRQAKLQQQADWQAQWGVGTGPKYGGVDAGTPTGDDYAQQFPSLYDQGGQAPDWMGGGAGGAGAGFTFTPATLTGAFAGIGEMGPDQAGGLPTEPPTGSVPYGARTAPTIEDRPQQQAGFWYNQITGEKDYSGTKPTGGYAPAGWMFKASPKTYGPPTPYYEAGGGWKEWK